MPTSKRRPGAVASARRSDDARGRPKPPPQPPTPQDASQGHSSPSSLPLVLAEFRRTVDGEPGAVRITLGDFNGRPTLQVRHWIKGQRGWIPTKSGVTVRVDEIDATIAALGKAKLAMLNQAADRSATAKPVATLPREHPARPVRKPDAEAEAWRRSVAPWEEPA